MEMLDTEIIESIAPLIRGQFDLINWLKCYKMSKNCGDLLLILELEEKQIIWELWPSLMISKQMDREDCNLVGRISKYYKNKKSSFMRYMLPRSVFAKSQNRLKFIFALKISN